MSEPVAAEPFEGNIAMSTMTMELITEFTLPPPPKVKAESVKARVERPTRELPARDLPAAGTTVKDRLATTRSPQSPPAQLIRIAMQHQDDLVLELSYEDRYGGRTQRIVSPIRFLGTDRFLAFCLCRCEPRQFQLSRCSNIALRRAADYVMPVQLEALSN